MQDAGGDSAEGNVARDRALGMGCPITRRDFVNGMAVAAGAVLAPGRMLGGHPWWLFQDGEYAPERDPHYYPPGLTGLRGDHAGSFEVAHQMRDGGVAALVADARPTRETFDLVIVGGGISGLAAAHFYRKAAGPSARILVLDNHDDFGGHAKRNEFHVGGRTLLGYGGAQSLDGPDNYSPAAKALLADAGVVPKRFYTAFDQQFFPSRHLGDSVFFDKETFGADHLATGAGTKPWADVLAGAPLSERVRRDLTRLYEEEHDYLPGLTRAQKRARLARMSYRDYLVHVAGVTPDAIPYFQRITADLWCAGIDVISALSPYNDGFRAGYRGMGLGDEDPAPGTRIGPTPPDGEDPYIFHFPDGNASLARLLVRRLVPGAAAGTTMDDIVTARVNYAKLDDPAHTVRIRLNSTAVRVRHVGDPSVGARSGGHLRPGRQGVDRPGAPRRARVLELGERVSLPGATRAAAAGNALRRQRAVRVHERRASELGGVERPRHQLRVCAGQLLQHCRAGLPSEPRHLSFRADACRSDRGAHDAGAVQTRISAPRSVSCGASGAAGDTVRGDGAEHARSAARGC